MKLRNKETGEIGRIAKTKTDDEEIQIITDTKVYLYQFISDVYRHWEDYEEPKEYWYIDDSGCIMIDQVLSSVINMRKSIGNYFETREEAEKAQEKLKAWKRLKNEGMKIYSFQKEKAGIDLDFYTLTILAPRDEESLNLLFGGEK